MLLQKLIAAAGALSLAQLAVALERPLYRRTNETESYSPEAEASPEGEISAESYDTNGVNQCQKKCWTTVTHRTTSTVTEVKTHYGQCTK